MKKTFDELLLELGEIAEFQYCIADVLENCMYHEKRPFYALSLIKYIIKRTDELHEEFDDFEFQQNSH